ncbi:MAG: Hsp20 family protein [Gammaproteobacteria bacterium]|nr:Hsp20 family protein [Gammaproteobacteria bacterium]MDH3481841.1 Hsp20 family protein [Gammaproteobacteria bacterium]
MSNLKVQKVRSPEDRKLPVFKEFDEIADQIRVRAYNLFANRGFSMGNDVDDWLSAQREICWPTAELVEEDDEFEIKVALAGFEPKEISVTATPREIIVKAAHNDKRKEGDEKVRWSEFRSNDVYRQIALPSDIDVDKIEAEFEHGMLEIEAPKKKGKSAAAKKIKVTKAT